MNQVGVALIGTGMWGRRLGTVVKRTPSLRLVTCYSRTTENRNVFATEFECESTASFEAATEHPDVQG